MVHVEVDVRCGRLNERQQEMVESCLRLAWRLASRSARHLPRWAREGAADAAETALMWAASLYDESRGVRFTTFAHVCVRSALRTYARRVCGARARMVSLSVEVTSGVSALDELIEAEQREDEEDFLDWFWRSVDGLPERLKVAVRMRHCDGEKFRKIGARLGVGSQRAIQLVNRGVDMVCREEVPA